MRLLEDGSERGGALGSDVISLETVRDGWGQCEQACQRALTGNQILGGGGAHEFGDLRLVEDGSQRSGTLGSDVVASETASEGQDGNSERVGVSTGADTKANTLRRRRTQGSRSWSMEGFPRS